VRRIADVDREAWNRVFPATLEGYDLFKALDESGFEQFSFYYILVYAGQELVGGTVCFLMDYSLDTSISGPLRRVSNAIKRINPNIFSLKAVICGLPMAQGRIGAVRDPATVTRVIVRRMEQIARKERAAVIAFKDFDRSYLDMLDPLRQEGFSRIDSLPTTELGIRFNDFEQYIETLSPAGRYDLRRKLRKADRGPRFTLEVVDSLDDKTLGEVYKLYLDIVDEHDMKFELLPVSFFTNVPKHMPGCTKFFLWRLEGKLSAFLFCLVSDDVLLDYYAGLDYSIAHKYHLYFVKFRDVINWCITHKVKKYEMGITGYEAKRRLGFDFIPLYLYAKLRNPFFRPLFNGVCRFLKFENFDPSLKTARRKIVS